MLLDIDKYRGVEPVSPSVYEGMWERKSSGAGGSTAQDKHR